MKSLEIINQILEKNQEQRKKKSEEYNRNGDEHFKNGEYDAAISDYSKAIKLNPDFQVAINNLKNAKMKKEEEEERK